MTYVHDLSPFAIQFTEHFGIRWYGLAYLTGFITGYYALVMMTRRGGSLFTTQMMADFTTYCAIGVLVGGRLGYCLFYAPELWTSFDNSFPYWGVLKVNEGGMASHGGILGVLFVSWLFARKHKIPFWHCQDVTVFGGALGFFFGRIANFINGELYGREAPATLAWAVKFPGEMLMWVQRDFQKLYTLKPAVQALGVDPVTWTRWLDGFSAVQGARGHVYETIEQLIAAVQAHNATVIAALGPALTPRHPSQLYQAVLEGLLVFLALCWIWRKPQKPGVIAAWFGVLYCIARIIGEEFRMPDAQIGYQLWGLTRGQWLSIGMLAVAIALLVFMYRRPVAKMGGWNPGEHAVKPRAKA